MEGSSIWDKLKSGIAGIGDTAKSLLPKSPVTDDTQLRKSLSLPSDGPGTTVAGGRRHRRKTRKGGRKSRKTHRKY